MTIKKLILDKVEESFLIAEKHYNRTFDRPRNIVWDERTTTAGHCAYGKSELMFNPILAMENEEDFIATTVPHEVAHWIECVVYGMKFKRTRRGKIRWIHHGTNWKYIMEHVFKLAPDRCHAYDVKVLPNRRTRVVSRDFTYTCPCNKIRNLTSVRHNKILKGKKFICTSCRGNIFLLTQKTPEQIQIEKLTRQLEALKQKQSGH